MASKLKTSTDTGKTARSAEPETARERRKSIKYNFDITDIRKITIEFRSNNVAMMGVVVNPPRPKGPSTGPGGGASG